VRLPPGTGFDPGGIGKGLAADMICSELMADGAEGACVNLGGDLRVAGVAPDSGSWTVAVEHPWAPEPVAMLGLAGGAIATSTTLRRRWHTAGEVRHHLIDPQTGQTSDSDVNLAAVVAAEAWVAEVIAKAVLLAGAAHPFDIIGGTGADALAVDDHGAVHSTAGLGAFLGGATLPARLSPAADRPDALALHDASIND
jgi:FAD:protein FMN transferase